MSALGVEYGCPYVLEGPDGSRTVFNDDTDEDFVGILSPESSGLDSADVREDATDAVEADGRIQGNNYFGGRPVVLQGTIIASGPEDRNEKVAKLKAASNAMRGDATLTWEPKGGAKVELKLRRQQPLRITKGYVKEFQVPMVAADIFPKGTTKHVAANYDKTKFPSTAASSGSGAAWSNPTMIEVEGTSAESKLTKTEKTSAIISANAFGFAAPAGLSIDRIIVTIKRGGSTGGKIHGELKLQKNGVAAGETVVEAASSWAIAYETATRPNGGEETVLEYWGTALTAEELNNAGFGFQLVAKNDSELSVNALIDFVKVRAISTVGVIVNAGDSDAYPTIKVFGPGKTFELENETTGELLLLEGVELKESEYFEIDFKNHTIKKNGETDAYNALVFAESKWWTLPPGENELRLPSNAVVEWQDTYL